MEPIWALGLMSGTSLDGIDGATLLTDGERLYEKGPDLYVPYDADFQDRLRSQLGQRVPDSQIAAESTRRHIDVVQKILAQTDKPIQVIGYHGQTTVHAPPLTIQMGDGPALAKAVGLPVVYDFRTADCLAGGQGAPLVPVYHQALCVDREFPVVVINIGGVANLTYIDQERLIAGDTGPGNALINDGMRRDFGQAFDRDGHVAASGCVNEIFLKKWLQDPYFSNPFPKSLDRDHFSRLTGEVNGQDGIATLTALTVHAILKSIDLLPHRPREILLCGGGAKNKTLLTGLKEGLGKGVPITILPDSDMIEAQAFAFLAVRVLRGLPTSFPTTTGCREPVWGGKVCGR
jgi:anhydro-N-acetylmuramic acid kinase